MIGARSFDAVAQTENAMRAKPEILFLAHRIPYPPDKGDKIRSWRLVEHLARRFRVHLAAFVDDPADFAHEAFLNGVCESVFLAPLHPRAARVKSAAGLLTGEPLSFAYYRDAAMVRHVEEVRARDLAAEFAFSSSMAPYIAAARGTRPRFIDLCDADSEKWRQYAGESSGPMRLVYAREARRLAAAEATMINWADAAFAASPAEAALLSAMPGVTQRVTVCGNGVDCDYFSPQALAAPAGAAEIVFTGAMDYAANVDAVVWFARDAWPAVRDKAHGARFAIVGANPSKAVRALASLPGVAVTGKVDDVRPWLQQARVAVAPLRIARGVQNKVLEAMAMAKPVVATAAANAGVGARPDTEIIIADEAPSFADAVAGLLTDRARAAGIGSAARARIVADFRWPARLAAIDAALASRGL